MQPVWDFLQTLFGPLINLFGNGLEFFNSLGVPWWLSIALLTVIVRSLLFPLTIRQVKSMRAMQELKPEMDKIKAKYKDNRQKQQEEIMKLYQERQINPLGSCLPILIQMPIFITVYYVIRTFDQTHAGFSSGGALWFKDLTVADPYYILPIISAITMFASMEITARNAEPQQRWLMRIMPVGFAVFLARFPAGLFMYWTTSNLFTFGQNYFIYHLGPARKTPTSGKEPSRNNTKDEPKLAPSEKNGDSTGSALQQRPKGASSRRRKRKKKR